MSKIVKATVNGVQYTLNYDSASGGYKAEVTAPTDSSYQNNEGHYFPVSITATDEAGNSTTISDVIGDFKDNLKLLVKEQVKPTVVDVSPSKDAAVNTSTPTFEFTVLDNANSQETGFSGINPDSIVLTINGVAVNVTDIEITAVTGGYHCKYTSATAIDDGQCTFNVSVSDYDGNQNEVVDTAFKIDTIPPVLEIYSPTDNLYINTPQIVVNGKTSDITSSPVVVTITVDGVDQGTVTLNDEGAFEKTILLAQEGGNTIEIVATDKAGKVNTVVRTVILKTDVPEFETVQISPNPVNCGKTYTIFVSFVDDEE